MLAPIADACRGAQKVTNGLEVVAISLASNVNRLLGKHAEAIAFIELLRETRPVAFEFAEAVRRGDISGRNDLALLLREDYPRMFEAQLLAVILETEKGGVSDTTFLEQLRAIVPLAVAASARDQLARIAVQACGSEDNGIFQTYEALCRELVGADHDYLHLMSAAQASEDGRCFIRRGMPGSGQQFQRFASTSIHGSHSCAAGAFCRKLGDPSRLGQGTR